MRADQAITRAQMLVAQWKQHHPSEPFGHPAPLFKNAVAQFIKPLCRSAELTMKPDEPSSYKDTARGRTSYEIVRRAIVDSRHQARLDLYENCGGSLLFLRSDKQNLTSYNLMFDVNRRYKLKERFPKFLDRELSTGVLLITCGLPGTWKTETSEEISRIKGYPILRSDLIRLEVLKGEDIFDEKVASDMSKRTMVYDEVFRRADEALDKADSVIIDATFITQSLRRRAAEIAAKHNKTFVILQTHCPQEVAIGRILRRSQEDYESNALTEQAYLNNKRKFEEVDVDDLKRLYPKLKIIHVTVDTQYDPPEDWYIIGMKKR